MSHAAPPGRTLSVRAFLVVAVVYVVVIHLAGLVTVIDTPDGTPFPTAEAVLRNGTIPLGISALFAAAVATWLGWWERFGRSGQPGVPRRWVVAVPGSMVICALLAINYGNLADQTAGLVLALIAMAAFVGFTEELMFRGIGVTTLRTAGLSEGHVALWSSVIFGLVHLSNALSTGYSAIGQALIVSTSGYFFYLGLRAGGILLPMVTHALWDFSLISSQVGPAKPEAYFGLVLVIVLQLVLIIVALARFRHVEQAAPAP